MRPTCATIAQRARIIRRLPASPYVATAGIGRHQHLDIAQILNAQHACSAGRAMSLQRGVGHVLKRHDTAFDEVQRLCSRIGPIAESSKYLDRRGYAAKRIADLMGQRRRH